MFAAGSRSGGLVLISRSLPGSFDYVLSTGADAEVLKPSAKAELLVTIRSTVDGLRSWMSGRRGVLKDVIELGGEIARDPADGGPGRLRSLRSVPERLFHRFVEGKLCRGVEITNEPDDLGVFVFQ
jgi:hypothetical protein